MTTTPTLDGARPEAAPVRRRLLRVGLAAGVVTALVGGGLTATSAQTAQAATKTVAPHTALKVSDRSVTTKQRPLVRFVARSHGKNLFGKVRFVVDGHTKKVTILRHGAAAYHMPKGMSAGTHRVTVVFAPTSKGVHSAKRTTTVKVHKYSSRVVERAVKYTGVHYVYGGTSPRGFDCSGFTSYVYKKATGKTLPRTSSGQRHVGKVVSKKHAKAGDLVYTPGHVGIYVGGGKIIDAPRPGKSIHVRKMWATSWTYIHVSSKATTI